MKKVLRLTRHELTVEKERFLKDLYGDEVQVETVDVPYGDDPVVTVMNIVHDTEKNGDRVIAIEVVAPFPVKMKLVDAQRRIGRLLIQSVTKRGEDGRSLVIGTDAQGRDILAFSHYEELVKIEFVTRSLEQDRLSAIKARQQ